MNRRYHLHLPGLLYCSLCILVALAAMNTQNNLLFWIFGIMCGGLLVSGLVSGMMMLNLRLHRLDPQYGAVGEPLLIRYALTNRSRFLPAFNLVVAEHPVRDDAHQGGQPWQRLTNPATAWIMHVGPGETVHGEAVHWPTARGEARFDRIRVLTTFPFGLIKKSITFSQPQHTLIYPQLYKLRNDVLRAATPPAMIGNRSMDRTGLGDEYFGLREYQSGDAVRSIAWKRSAQLDRIVCIERASPSPPRLRILLDLTVATDKLRVAEGTSPRELEERAISLAASVAHAAHHAGMEISLAAMGVHMPRIGMRRGQRHLRKILAVLAAIDLDAPRHPLNRPPMLDAERAGVVAIHPHRVDPWPGRGEVLHLTAGQMESLVVEPIGWDARDIADHAAPATRPAPSGAAA